jgi:hypothetical protein
MNKLRITAVAALFAALGTLAACTDGTTTDGTNTSGISIEGVVSATKIACAFVPTAASVASIFTSDPAVTTIESAVSLICNALDKAKLKVGTTTNADTGAIVLDVRTPNGKVVKISGFVATK